MKIILLIVFTAFVFGCTTPSNQEVTSVNYDSISAVLDSIYDLDQQGRKEGWDWSKIHEIDISNQEAVINIIEKFGWIDSSKVGEKASVGMFLVIQHAELDTQKKYFPLLDEKSKLGEANQAHCAMMEDRILMREGKKQIYGTQAWGERNENGDFEMFIWPIKDPENVNKLRENVGMELTVEENAANMGATYDPDRTLPTGN